MRAVHESGMDIESDTLINDDDRSSFLLVEDAPRKKEGDSDSYDNAFAVTGDPRTRDETTGFRLSDSHVSQIAVVRANS